MTVKLTRSWPLAHPGKSFAAAAKHATTCALIFKEIIVKKRDDHDCRPRLASGKHVMEDRTFSPSSP
jgi:hypothetical protein